MTDDKSGRVPADASRIDIHEDYEVEYWTRQLRVTPDQLKEAVTRVGADGRGREEAPGAQHAYATYK
ncbi:MAG TPA: DUF3606 domain-containing protein [Polyangiales bacterium]|nr:DUF3606 domain-containing protein [Polyangiales bacterium]